MKCSFLATAAVTLVLFVSPGMSETILSDNLANDRAYPASTSNVWIAAEFRTDSTAYLLSTATLILNELSIGQAHELELYSNLMGHPGLLLGTLTRPFAYTSGISPVTFNGNGLTLLPNSSYWLALEITGGGEVDWYYTYSNAGLGVGFVPNSAYSIDNGVNWGVGSSDPLLLQVSAEPLNLVPEPSLAKLIFLAGVLASIAFIRRNRRQLQPREPRAS